MLGMSLPSVAYMFLFDKLFHFAENFAIEDVSYFLCNCDMNIVAKRWEVRRLATCLFIGLFLQCATLVFHFVVVVVVVVHSASGSGSALQNEYLRFNK